MRIVERFNNNAVLCMDADGREVVAIGTGIGFPSPSEEVPLERIKRTFYGVDHDRLALLNEIDPGILELSAEVVDVARQILSYKLSPNTPFSLADHIAFAIERAQNHMVVRMPLAFDVQQNYPLEYRLGCYAARQAQERFCPSLPENEATGIALCIANSATGPSSKARSNDARSEARMLERLTRMVEQELRISIDRNGFDYARFATHVLYLLRRAKTGESIASENSELYRSFSALFPDVKRCTDAMAAVMDQSYDAELTDEEKLYLMLHINRLRNRQPAASCDTTSSRSI